MRVAVVVPCYKVKKHIIDVLARIPKSVVTIYVVDDACPEGSGALVSESLSTDPRIRVLYHNANQGVGGAVITGYTAAQKEGLCDIVVKLDGDGQMNPALIENLVRPIEDGRADYTKGNRYFNLEHLVQMPKLRIFGNAGLSFASKVSSGYWSIMDPTNGFTAIHIKVLKLLPLDQISRSYFFESDILFRLNCLRAVVADVPMASVYGNETSNLRVSHALVEFSLKHIGNFCKRIFYNYLLRDFGVGSVQLFAGLGLLAFGLIFGITQWIEHSRVSQLTPTGTVFLAALPTLLGIQLLLSALNYDILCEPKDCLFRRLG